MNSSGVWPLPPTGPTPQIVGAPAAAAKPESAQPPVKIYFGSWPSSFKPAP